MAEVFIGVDELPLGAGSREYVRHLLDVFASHAMATDVLVYTRVWPGVRTKRGIECVARVSIDCNGEEEMIAEGSSKTMQGAIRRAFMALQIELEERIRHLHWSERRAEALA